MVLRLECGMCVDEWVLERGWEGHMLVSGRWMS